MSTELIKVTINGRDFQVAKGARLIDVCRENQFRYSLVLLLRRPRSAGVLSHVPGAH